MVPKAVLHGADILEEVNWEDVMRDSDVLPRLHAARDFADF